MNSGSRQWLMSFLLAFGAHVALWRYADSWLRCGQPRTARVDLADGATPMEVTLQMIEPPAPVAAPPTEPTPAPAEPVAIEEPVIVAKPVLIEPAPVEAHVDRVDKVDGMDAAKTSAPETVAKSEAGKGPGLPASDSQPAGQAGGPAPLSSIFPRYPMGSRLRGEEGPVRLRARVDGRGRPVEVTVAQSSGFFALDAAAVKAVKGARFVPPAPDAPPESFEAELTIRFQLKDP